MRGTGDRSPHGCVGIVKKQQDILERETVSLEREEAAKAAINEHKAAAEEEKRGQQRRRKKSRE